jgi:hypothetical protein
MGELHIFFDKLFLLLFPLKQWMSLDGGEVRGNEKTQS